LEGLKNGDADVHSGLSFSKEREEWIGFSTRFYETFTRIYHRVGDPQPTGRVSIGTPLKFQVNEILEKVKIRSHNRIGKEGLDILN